MRSSAFEAQAAVARAMVDESYSAFAGRRLKLNFDERCSPFSDRQELAQQMSREDLRVVDEESMAVYSFKSLYTMGTNEDLLYFLPRIFDLVVESVINPKAEWNSHETLWLKKLSMLVEAKSFSVDELAFVSLYLDALWVLITLDHEQYWHLAMDFLEYAIEIHPIEHFFTLWLDSATVEVLHVLGDEATQPCGILHYGPVQKKIAADIEAWLMTERVAEKVSQIL